MWLGIDGGGSKTEAVLLDLDGKELGRAQGGPCNLSTCSDETLRKSLAQAIEGALAQAASRRGAGAAVAGAAPAAAVRALCIGAAGSNAPERRQSLERILRELLGQRGADEAPIRIEPDFVIAHAGASEAQASVAVVAGTGSVVFGRDARGRTCRVGGRGYLLHDPGSGYWIGAEALRRTLRRLDLHLDADEFDRRVLDAVQAREVETLVRWISDGFHPSKVARLAAQVGEWAEEGDSEAIRLLEEASAHLAEQTARVLELLQLAPEDAPLYALGGLWNLQGGLRRRFEERVGTELQAPLQDPAYGAALLARG